MREPERIENTSSMKHVELPTNVPVDFEKAHQQMAMLGVLNQTHSNIYGGTVPPIEVKKRRRKNKEARKQRVRNRRLK